MVSVGDPQIAQFAQVEPTLPQSSHREDLASTAHAVRLGQMQSNAFSLAEESPISVQPDDIDDPSVDDDSGSIISGRGLNAVFLAIRSCKKLKTIGSIDVYAPAADDVDRSADAADWSSDPLSDSFGGDTKLPFVPPRRREQYGSVLWQILEEQDYFSPQQLLRGQQARDISAAESLRSSGERPDSTYWVCPPPVGVPPFQADCSSCFWNDVSC